LSVSIQGVTLLAIGNGAPDIFASFTATIHGAPAMGISSTLGFVLEHKSKRECIDGATDSMMHRSLART